MLLRRNIRLFHLNFTTNIDDFESLRRRGQVAVELTYLAFDHERFDDTPLSDDVAQRWAAEVVFIGHHEPRTERFVRGLLEAGIPIRVYGWGWGRRPIARSFPQSIVGKMLSDVDYVSAIKGAKIALCCVSQMNYNQTAARSYEIPACGTFLLAMRTPQHLESYVEGKEAEFFETPEELVGKARFYLDHDAERREIARAGHNRCVKDEYTWARYMRDDWMRTTAAFSRWKARGSSAGE
jgi:spore maturation protein CgeB